MSAFIEELPQWVYDRETEDYVPNCEKEIAKRVSEGTLTMSPEIAKEMLVTPSIFEREHLDDLTKVLRICSYIECSYQVNFVPTSQIDLDETFSRRMFIIARWLSFLSVNFGKSVDSQKWSAIFRKYGPIKLGLSDLTFEELVIKIINLKVNWLKSDDE